MAEVLNASRETGVMEHLRKLRTVRALVSALQIGVPAATTAVAINVSTYETGHAASQDSDFSADLEARLAELMQQNMTRKQALEVINARIAARNADIAQMKKQRREIAIQGEVRKVAFCDAMKKKGMTPKGC